MDDEKQGDVSIDLFAALDMESEAVNERSPELENNQTLGLLTGFLSVGDWYVKFYFLHFAWCYICLSSVCLYICNNEMPALMLLWLPVGLHFF